MVEWICADKARTGQMSGWSEQEAEQHEIILNGQKGAETERKSAADEATLKSKEKAVVMLSERVDDGEVSILQDVKTEGREQGIDKRMLRKA